VYVPLLLASACTVRMLGTTPTILALANITVDKPGTLSPRVRNALVLGDESRTSGMWWCGANEGGGGGQVRR
jgi:hypothetical protein